MALVIEDGTGVVGATSFVTRIEFIAYAAARGYTVPDADSSDVFAFNAMDYIRFKEPKMLGERAYTTQELPFPRKGIVYGDRAEDYVYTIPQNVKSAQLSLMLSSFNGLELVVSRSADAQITKEIVGPIETDYADAGASYSPTLPLVDALLSEYLIGGFGGFGLRTVRV